VTHDGQALRRRDRPCASRLHPSSLGADLHTSASSHSLQSCDKSLPPPEGATCSASFLSADLETDHSGHSLSTPLTFDTPQDTLQSYPPSSTTHRRPESGNDLYVLLGFLARSPRSRSLQSHCSISSKSSSKVDTPKGFTAVRAHISVRLAPHAAPSPRLT